MDRETALRRIKHALAMGTRDTTPENERETAIRQANFLMRKFQIEKHELGMEDDMTFVDETLIKLPTNPNYVIVLGAVAELFYCKMLYSQKRKLASIIGEEVARILTINVYESLTKSIQKESNSLYKEYDVSLRNKKRWQFRKGASYKILIRCVDMKEENKNQKATDENTGRELTIFDDAYKIAEQNNSNFIMERHEVREDSRANKFKPTAEFYQGMEYGDSLNINGKSLNAPE